jgi:hypothetical protein
MKVQVPNIRQPCIASLTGDYWLPTRLLREKVFYIPSSLLSLATVKLYANICRESDKTVTPQKDANRPGTGVHRHRASSSQVMGRPLVLTYN